MRSEFLGGHAFGFGTLHQVDLFRRDEDGAFHPLSLDQLIGVGKKLAWSNGRPDVYCLHSLPDPDNDPPKVINEYRASNYWFSRIVYIARTQNPALHTQLITPVAREKSGAEYLAYCPSDVPQNYKDVLYPMSGIYGYALPRVAMERLKAVPGPAWDKVLNMSKCLSELIATSADQAVFLAKLCERAVLDGADSKRVLQHALSYRVLDEQNNYSDFELLHSHLQVHAPTAMKIYSAMSRAERLVADIFCC